MKDIEDYGEQVQLAFGLEETEWSSELGKAWEGELIESVKARPLMAFRSVIRVSQTLTTWA